MGEIFKNNSRKDSYTPPSYSGGSIRTDDISRVLPRQISTGTMRGTQTVGFGNTKIDGSNNVITIGDTITLDGNTGTIVVKAKEGSTQGLGTIPGTQTNETGFFALDSNGKLVMKIVDGIIYYYNPNDSYNNNIRIGSAPVDGRTGIWVSKNGQDATKLLGG